MADCIVPLFINVQLAFCESGDLYHLVLVELSTWICPAPTALVSFDGSPVCEYCAPSLSTIEQPIEALGETATEYLIARMENADDKRELRVVIPSRFIRRDSIGANSKLEIR
ncbi:substrate-binding domain-containing protein [Shinella oryzae]|uniref:substrate-binding domain-containing protein n=1 Tax=Shinella oryzae TaxID=2871820 RepID=UPI001FF5A4C0|nr:substrate-binding domain-containing protein [Shinella oryzae]